jgi:HdeA/HdeB family
VGVGTRERIAAAALLGSTVLLPPAAETDQHISWKKIEINKLTCEEFAAVAHREQRERILVYMNGYLDGTRKVTTWDAELVGQRIDEILRMCAANPKVPLLDAFERAWSR